jgi:membrane protein YqaA with SNARE-associated domain
MTGRGLKAWIERFADSQHASVWLFALAAVEASLFPVPPDVLLIALCLAHPRRSTGFAAICTAGSVAGSLIGYGIGFMLFDAVGSTLVSVTGLASQFALVLTKYREHAWVTILLAGFTPIPFAAFTLAAGFNGIIGLATFVPAVIIGRSARFFLVGGLLQFLRPRMQASFIGLLETLSIAFGVLVILGIVTVTYLF